MTDTPTAPTGGSTNGSNGKVNNVMSIGSDVLDQVQDALKGGKIRAVRIKIGNKTVREIPVDAAAVTAILIAAAAVLVSQLRVELDKG